MNGTSNSKVLEALVEKAGHGILVADVEGMSLNLMLELAKRFEDYLGKEFVCDHEGSKVVIRLKNTSDIKDLNWCDGAVVEAEANDLMVFDSIKVTAGNMLDLQAIVARTDYTKRKMNDTLKLIEVLSQSGRDFIELPEVSQEFMEAVAVAVEELTGEQTATVGAGKMYLYVKAPKRWASGLIMVASEIKGQETISKAEKERIKKALEILIKNKK
jgi:hypothetical protein